MPDGKGPMSTTETRDEHLQWAKDRALAYVDKGELENALASIASDLNKHEETHNHATDMLIALVGTSHAINGDVAGMRRFIEGFH